MEYKIGELSEITHLSKEMIRYYEKLGAVRPKRRDDNNYRVYTTMDLFALLESIQLKAFDMNIREISEVKGKDYTDTILEYFRDYRDRLERELVMKQALLDRTRELIVRNEESRYNLGNYWIRMAPAICRYTFLNSRNDEYFDVVSSDKVNEIVFSEEGIRFTDDIIIFGEDCDTWCFAVRSDYVPLLELPEAGKVQVGQQLCFCTVVDMGEIGAFSHECLAGLIQQAGERGYRQAGPVYGVLCGRGVEQVTFRRYLELRMPIER